MARILLFLTPLFMLLCFSLPKSAQAADILVLPTVMDQKMEAWHYVPANSEPALYPTKQVYRGQSFRLLIIAKEYTTDSLQNANISYSVQIFAPDGTPLFDSETILELFKGHVKTSDSLLLSQQYLTLDFSENDPSGAYTFKITAHDLLAKQESTATAKIALANFSDRVNFESTEAFSDWLANYYRDPDPARAISALLQYVEPELTFVQKQTPLLIFLSRIIQTNPFLWPQLKSIYATNEPVNQKKILLLSALSGVKDDPFFSSLKPEASTFHTKALNITLPTPTNRPNTRIEVEMLWAEFAATGTIEPIRKLVGALYLESTKGTQEKMATGELEATAETKTMAELESVYQTALGSLLHNGEKHSLVKQYLGYIYELDNPEPVIKNQLEAVLAILKERTNEEAARQHMEKTVRE